MRCNPGIVVNVPGISGGNAYSIITASFVVPANSSTVSVSVDSTAWMQVGLIVYEQSSGFYSIQTITSSNSVILNYLPISTYPTNSYTGTTVSQGSKLSPSGSAGQGPYTTLTGSQLVGSGSSTLNVASTSWMADGQIVVISNNSNGALYMHLKVGVIFSSTQFNGNALNYSGDTPGTYADGSNVAVSGQPISIGTLPAVVVDSSGGVSSGAVIPATVGEFTLAFFVNLVDLAAADTITALVLGYNFKIKSIKFVVEHAVTTAAKAATLTPYINGAGITVGVLNLTSANCTPKGAVVAATGWTAPSVVGTSTQGFSITGSAITAFAEGSGWIILEIQNYDDANAFANLTLAVNALITAL